MPRRSPRTRLSWRPSLLPKTRTGHSLRVLERRGGGWGRGIPEVGFSRFSCSGQCQFLEKSNYQYCGIWAVFIVVHHDHPASVGREFGVGLVSASTQVLSLRCLFLDFQESDFSSLCAAWPKLG